MFTRFKALTRLASTAKFTYAPSFQYSRSGPKEITIEPFQAVRKELYDEASISEITSRINPPPTKLTNVAVILSGCGVQDGSEITEAVSFLISLSSRKIKFQCYAPNKDQADVMNHITGEAMNETRNVLVEAGRVARGNVKDIKELQQTKYDGVFFPGGLGVVKNLSNFSTTSTTLAVDPSVEKVLREFHDNNKPIGMACISPVLAAKLFGKTGKDVSLTVGKKRDYWPYKDIMDAIEELGAKHMNRSVDSCYIDVKNLIVTTPAFVKDTSNFHRIYQGIDNLVGSVEELLTQLNAIYDSKRKVEIPQRRKEEVVSNAL